ncbi:MAG TPA: tyrosinase family protein [Ktedonobacteraceae bacterium]|nr:tyrosinase family protein [Ktedonobacteraceae bacterium]
MANLSDLQEKIDYIISGPRRGGIPLAPTVLARTPTALAATRATVAPAAPRSFSEFVFEDVERASEIASSLISIAKVRGGEEGLADAVAEIDRLRAAEQQPGLVQHAVKLFITHYPLARQTFRWKPLEKRQPNLVVPSRSPTVGPPVTTGLRAEIATTAQQAGGTPPEDRLDFWREDPLLNEHHEHWHLVYPTAPISDTQESSSPGDKYHLGNRHGELFAYMHQQMLARYDAERLAVGLARVEQFDRYVVPIPQGYNPGPLALWDGGLWTAFRARPRGATLSDLTADGLGGRLGAKLAEQATFRDRLLAAAQNGYYELAGSQIPATIDTQGNTEEANRNSVDYYQRGDARNFQVYGNHHNIGHLHFMLFDNVNPIGVMGTTATAIRDPVFFRWHKHVDALFQALQQNLAPYDFSDGPPVRLRKKSMPDGSAHSLDIILCRQYDFPTEIQLDDAGSIVPVDGDTAGTQLFGYSENADQNKWDLDFSSTTTSVTATLPLGDGTTAQRTLYITTTDELRTDMRKRQILLETGLTINNQPVLGEETISYLSHDDYYYFLRVENTSAQPQSVTVRIFLTPETEIEDRTSWIEMDRFLTTLEGSQRRVIYRPADLSSVVRQPALKWQDLTATDEPSPKTELQPWCDCGWPYTTLLPRGTAEGMLFRLFVMCSPGADLTLPDTPDTCVSMSYCGLQDMDYPDSRDMGYPFNRPFQQSISATVAARDNMAWRTIKIRCTNLDN